MAFHDSACVPAYAAPTMSFSRWISHTYTCTSDKHLASICGISYTTPFIYDDVSRRVVRFGDHTSICRACFIKCTDTFQMPHRITYTLHEFIFANHYHVSPQCIYSRATIFVYIHSSCTYVICSCRFSFMGTCVAQCCSPVVVGHGPYMHGVYTSQFPWFRLCSPMQLHSDLSIAGSGYASTYRAAS